MSSENVSRGGEVISSHCQMFYKQVDEFAPRYKYVKIYMSNILGNTIAVTATGTTAVQFKLPYNTVINLARSKIGLFSSFSSADRQHVRSASS